MKNTNWKTPTYLVGSAIGLLIGLVSAHLYARTVEENQESTVPAKISSFDILKLAVTMLGLVRQVTDLGARKSK